MNDGEGGLLWRLTTRTYSTKHKAPIIICTVRNYSGKWKYNTVCMVIKLFVAKLYIMYNIIACYYVLIHIVRPIIVLQL